jgi:23S rRNA pseudouridine1911/1915/1917 synthase
MSEPTPQHRIVVPSSQQPRPLKTLLREATGEAHRRLEKIIRGGRVCVNGEPCLDPGARPPAGAVITVSAHGAPAKGPERTPRTPLRGPGFVTVLEERELIAVSKQPGVVVIPTGRAGTAGSEDSTDLPLVARIAAALRLAGRRAEPLWVIHRIDRDTSGLVVFARSGPAYERLRAAFRRRTPRRVYLAWTRGVPAPAAGRLEDELLEDPRSHRVEVSEAAPGRGARSGGRGGGARRGKRAVLEYETEATGALADGTAIARVRVTLTTGRRNQIRAQLAHRGWPLLGDRWYGGGDDQAISRAALHAWHVAFEHPSRRGERVALTAPLPDDLLFVDRHLDAPAGPGPEE